MQSTAKDDEKPLEQLPGEAEAARARAQRDAELTMSERLERVHQLCAQLARLEPVVTEADGS